jgi:transposase-like protein
MTSIAGKIGCTAETLRRWCREAASRRSRPAAQTTSDKDRLKLLEREVKELRRANEILRKPVLSLPKGHRRICAGGACLMEFLGALDKR